MTFVSVKVSEEFKKFQATAVEAQRKFLIKPYRRGITELRECTELRGWTEVSFLFNLVVLGDDVLQFRLILYIQHALTCKIITVFNNN